MGSSGDEPSKKEVPGVRTPEAQGPCLSLGAGRREAAPQLAGWAFRGGLGRVLWPVGSSPACAALRRGEFSPQSTHPRWAPGSSRGERRSPVVVSGIPSGTIVYKFKILLGKMQLRAPEAGTVEARSPGSRSGPRCLLAPRGPGEPGFQLHEVTSGGRLEGAGCPFIRLPGLCSPGSQGAASGAARVPVRAARCEAQTTSSGTQSAPGRRAARGRRQPPWRPQGPPRTAPQDTGPTGPPQTH